ncbi:MAG: hypothetical protein RIM33_02735 [Alphaproteobacteria bacterium]
MAESIDAAERLDSDRSRIGSRLILAAWGVEIVAAAIGLLLAAVTLLTATEKLQEEKGFLSTTDWSNALLGSLPFIIVAIVELTKIPLATATYFANSIVWRTIFLLGLLFLMIVTAETVYNGFERQFTLRNAVIQELKNQVSSNEENIRALNAHNAELSQVTRDSILRDFEATLETINTEAQQSLSEIADREAGILAEHGGERGAILGDQIEAAQARIAELREDLRSERSSIEGVFQSSIDDADSSVNARREFLTNELSEIDSDRRELQERISEVSTQRVDTSNIDSLVEQSLADLEERYDQARNEVNGEIENRRSEISQQISRLQGQIDDTEARVLIEEDKSIFTRSEETIERLENDLAGYREEIQALEEELRGVSATERLAELTREEQDESQRIFENAERQREQIVGANEASVAPLVRQLDELNRRRQEVSADLSDTSVNAEKERLQEERNQQLEALENRINAQVAAQQEIIDQSRAELLDLESRNEDALRAQLSQINSDRETANALAVQRRAAANEDKERRLEELLRSEERVNENDVRVAALRENVVDLRRRIADEAQDSQIYRVAALMFSETAADVTNEDLRIVSFVWFGSLAAIVAWTGTLLAFGGLVAKYGGRRSYRGKGILWGVRALVVDARRRVREPKIEIREKEVPKEVVREVPVEKIVTKDVPRDVVVKELVYVPFFSDDPEVLSKQAITSADLARIPRPKEFPQTTFPEREGNESSATGKKAGSKRSRKRNSNREGQREQESAAVGEDTDQTQMDLGEDQK